MLEMRLYIQYRFVCESFAFENVCVMSHHGLKAIWASSSLEVVGTARGPSSVGRLMAVFFQFRQDRGFDPSGSRRLPIKESDRDQYAPMGAELKYY